LAACRHNAAISPHVIVAVCVNELLAVLPLALMDDGATVSFPIRFSDYNDIVVRPEHSNVAASLLNELVSINKGYSKVRLTNLRCDSNCVRAAKTILSDSEFNRGFKVTTWCPYILLPSSFDEYMASRGRKLRKNLNRALRKASECNLSVRELSADSFSAEELADVFLSLQLNRKGLNSCFESVANQGFAREAVSRLFTERRLRAFALIEKNRIVAIDLYMVGPNSLCSWNGGFLSEAAQWSPVKLLNEAAIRSAFALKLEEYDYLRGEHRYKLSWTNNRRAVGELAIDLEGHKPDRQQVTDEKEGVDRW
jgi:CelD/BcsL family acetyltransferase involved in cellulose biosynthesis